jgi:hypothetical protein
MARLEKGCAAVADYNEEVEEMIIWLKEFEPKLNISVQLDSTDPKEIKNLQGALDGLTARCFLLHFRLFALSYKGN